MEDIPYSYIRVFTNIIVECQYSPKLSTDLMQSQSKSQQTFFGGKRGLKFDKFILMFMLKCKGLEYQYNFEGT